MDATIYVRFSNQEQAQGDSERRQLLSCRELCRQKGWRVIDEIIDAGKSAFAGLNRSEGGALWGFESKARTGVYGDGHVLVVENLDRISRQGYDALLGFLGDMTRNGVTVATVDGSRLYKANERIELGPVIEAVVKAELAREESEKKSTRLRAAQQRKFEQAQEYAASGLYLATTKVVPAWIDVDPQTYAMTLNHKRVAVLREIFQWTIHGYGTPAIAKKLNLRGEPVWLHLGRRSNHGWTVGYLTKLVTNPAVVGEARPMNRPRHGKASSRGVVIRNRYPQAIDAVTFARAQAARQSRKNSSGAWQMTHGNLFSGVAKCAECGGRMKQEFVARAGNLRRSKPGQPAYPARQNLSYLKCHNAINRVKDEKTRKLKCTSRGHVRYEMLERAVLKIALHFGAGMPLLYSQDVSPKEIEVADAQRHIDEKQRQLENLIASFARTGSQSIEAAAVTCEADLLALRAQQSIRQDDLQRALATQPQPDHLKQVELLRRELESPDRETRLDARVRLKQVLRGLVTVMRCDADKDTFVVLGDNAIALVFDENGEVKVSQFLQQRIYGPDGEPDWNPDHEDQQRAA